MITIQVFGGASFEFDGIPKQGILTDRKKACMMTFLRGGFLFFEPCGSE